MVVLEVLPVWIEVYACFVVVVAAKLGASGCLVGWESVLRREMGQKFVKTAAKARSLTCQLPIKIVIAKKGSISKLSV